LADGKLTLKGLTKEITALRKSHVDFSKGCVPSQEQVLVWKLPENSIYQQAVAFRVSRSLLGKSLWSTKHDKQRFGTMPLALDIVVAVGTLKCLRTDSENPVVRAR
jgi:hypothetical protein